jgi:hypothetical protein
MEFIIVNVYLHGRGKISNLMNRFLHEFLDLTPAIILTVLSCKVNGRGWEKTRKISVRHA